MSDVFISYAREDAKIAQQISQLLKAQGQSVFLDSNTLVAGQSFDKAVERAVRDAKTVFVVLSGNTRRSRWVQQELTYALEEGQNKQIIPVLLDDSAKDNWVWPLVADRQAIILSRDVSPSDVAHRLKEVMKHTHRLEELVMSHSDTLPTIAGPSFMWRIIIIALVAALLGALSTLFFTWRH